jgi:methyltransferase (TIGR00027 family)
MTRTDNDTWDLATSVGATATMVAAHRALASRATPALIDDPFAEPLVRAVGVDYFVGLLDHEIGTGDDPFATMLRQTIDGIALRTRFYDTHLMNAVADGVRQVVILAAGLDTRAYRLPWPADTVVYEVDQPEVIDFKTGELDRLGARPVATHRAIGIDLRDDWQNALRLSGFDVQQPTAWIAEGLLIYLPPDAQDHLLRQITDISAAGSWLATEQVNDLGAFTDELPQQIASQMRARGVDIDMTELVYEGTRNAVPEYLTSLGWHVSTQEMREAFAASGIEMGEGDAATSLTAITNISAVLTNRQP